MDINKAIKKEIPIGEEFDCKVLYNDSRGAIHKEEYERLLSYCLQAGIIGVEKYLVEEKIPLELFAGIADERGKERHYFKEKLKAYHQEKDYRVAPFIYLLEKIEPSYKLNTARKEYADPMLDFPANIEVGHKFKGSNGFSRFFCSDSKVAINSANDDIETLINTLEIDDLTVYILDTEEPGYWEQDLVLYKLIKSREFNQVKAEVDKHISEKIAQAYLKF